MRKRSLKTCEHSNFSNGGLLDQVFYPWHGSGGHCNVRCYTYHAVVKRRHRCGGLHNPHSPPTVGRTVLPFKAYAINVGADSAPGVLAQPQPAQPTPTATPAPCVTTGPSGSATPSATGATSATATAISTNTPVPTGTGTAAVPTSTPTQPATATPTGSATVGASATATNTPVPTNTPTVTNTPTNTPLPTATPTPSPTPTPTPTTPSCTPGGPVQVSFTFVGGLPESLPQPTSDLTVSPWDWCPGSVVTATISFSSSPTPIQWVAFTFYFDPGGPSDGHVERILTVPVSGTTSNGTWSVTVTMPPDATIVHTHRIDVTAQNGSTDTFGGDPPGRIVLSYTENHY